MISKVAVIGAGNGGFAMAADLGLAGFDVNLYEFPEYSDNIQGIKDGTSINITGEARAGSYAPSLVTTDIKEAIDGVGAILVSTHASAHEPLAYLLGDHIIPNQLIFLFPGYVSSIPMSWIWKDTFGMGNVKCAEVMTLPYACRKTDQESVHVYRRTGKLGIAAFPGEHIDELYTFFQQIYPDSYKFGNIFEVALCNQNLLMHPTITLMNAGRIENANGDFDFYADGCTQSVEKVIDSMDQEILAIFKMLGFANQSSKEACEIRFGMSWDEVEKERKSWEIRGLNSLDTRYLTEDLPNGLVFLSSLAHQYSVPTPTCDAFIQLWEVISGQNFRTQGRTMEKLRLLGVSIEDLKKYLDTGLLE